jgi:hypothetical protein
MQFTEGSENVDCEATARAARLDVKDDQCLIARVPVGDRSDASQAIQHQRCDVAAVASQKRVPRRQMHQRPTVLPLE